LYINIPSINSDLKGYNFFSSLANDILHYCDKDIIFDFSECTFFAANMASPLGIIVRKLEHYGNHIEYCNFTNAEVKNILIRNTFLQDDYDHSTDQKQTVIPYRAFTLFQGKEFAKYWKESIEDNENIHSNIPKMSEPLKEQFHGSINELYNNSCIHSCSEEFGVSACGQFYPKKKENYVYNLRFGYRLYWKY
jgi:hypothetical protein